MQTSASVGMPLKTKIQRFVCVFRKLRVGITLCVSDFCRLKFPQQACRARFPGPTFMFHIPIYYNPINSFIRDIRTLNLGVPLSHFVCVKNNPRRLGNFWNGFFFARNFWAWGLNCGYKVEYVSLYLFYEFWVWVCFSWSLLYFPVINFFG